MIKLGRGHLISFYRPGFSHSTTWMWIKNFFAFFALLPSSWDDQNYFLSFVSVICGSTQMWFHIELWSVIRTSFFFRFYLIKYQHKWNTVTFSVKYSQNFQAKLDTALKGTLTYLEWTGLPFSVTIGGCYSSRDPTCTKFTWEKPLLPLEDLLKKLLYLCKFGMFSIDSLLEYIRKQRLYLHNH